MSKWLFSLRNKIRFFTLKHLMTIWSKFCLHFFTYKPQCCNKRKWRQEVSRNFRKFRTYFFYCSVDGKGYRGYQVLKVEDIPEDAIELIVQLVEGYDEEFDPENSTHLPIARFWKEPLPNGDADIMVAGTRTRTFKDDLKKLQLKFKVVIRYNKENRDHFVFVLV